MRLRADGFENHLYGIVEALESLVLRRRIGVVEFARAVAHVAGLGDLRANVVVQISSEMQNQVSEAVAERKGLLPELVMGQGRGQLANSGGVRGVAIGED